MTLADAQVRELRIADGLALSADYVTKTAAILAQRRKGKTYTGSVIAEELCEIELPWVALDPTGAWWGLRSSADGESVGYPVVVIGGQHGDLPLERGSGAIVADLVLDHPAWYVLDLSLLESRAAEREFATGFARHLHRRKMQPGMDFPLHVFVDEADMFVPQEKEGRGDLEMLGAFQAIVRRGGLHGLGVTLISQRPALVNKSVLTQLDLLVLLRLVAGNDQDAVDKNYLSRNLAKEDRDAVMGSLASLPVGEAWFFEPGEDLLARVKVRERRTFNSSATPKPGERRVEPTVLADVDLDALREKMADAVERAAESDPVELRRRVAALRGQVVALERDLATRPDAAPTVEYVSAILPDDWERLDALVETASALADRASDAAGDFRSGLHDFASNLLSVRRVPAEPSPSAARSGQPERIAPPSAGDTSGARRSAGERQDGSADADALSKAAREILETLARRSPIRLTASQVATLCGRKARGGSWNTAIATLRRADLIDEDPAGLYATDLGLRAAGVEREPLTYETWREALPVASRELLDELSTAYPNALTADELAVRVGRQPRGGSWNTAVATLIRNGLAVRDSDGLRYAGTA